MTEEQFRQFAALKLLADEAACLVATSIAPLRGDIFDPDDYYHWYIEVGETDDIEMRWTDSHGDSDSMRFPSWYLWDLDGAIKAEEDERVARQERDAASVRARQDRQDAEERAVYERLKAKFEG